MTQEHLPPNAAPATTGEPAPRIIDENTDMSTLTDQEIMKLMENMDHDDVQLDKVCSSHLSRVMRGSSDSR